MLSFLDDLWQTYTSTRDLINRLRLTTLRGLSRNSFHFQDVAVLGEAVAQGRVGIGDCVTGAGWLSPYAYWCLPKAYSPFRFETGYAANGDRMGVKMSPAPAYLPACQVPFRRDGLRLGFLYPVDTLGLNLELANPVGLEVPTPVIAYKSVDDQPWFFNLDHGGGNFSPNPEQWTYSFGDTALTSRIVLPRAKESTILTNPVRVREVVAVPAQCKPIPVLYPEGLARLNQHVNLKARLVAMDEAALGELSRLGAPLAARVYSLFSQHGMPAYCLKVEHENQAIQRAPDPLATPLPVPKMTTLLSEFYFERPSTGEIIPFGDDELIEWFIPCIKDLVFSVGQYVFSDRWAGKLYGFEGPIYVYKTGPVAFTISPTGFISANVIANINLNLAYSTRLLLDTVSTLRQKMIAMYERDRNEKLNVVNTYMTDTDWQTHLGKLLSGVSLDEAVRISSQYRELRQQLHSVEESRSSQDVGTSPPDSGYENILQIISNMSVVMERDPPAFAGMGEENLRTHFLVLLNGIYKGQATGETLNGQGKTDILIRVNGENVFIAECKFWKGEKAFLETITQLLGYVTHRDTKTAIVIFNRNKDFTSVLKAISEAVRHHPNYKRTQSCPPALSETATRCVLTHPNDPNREVTVTVLAFDVPI